MCCQGTRARSFTSVNSEKTDQLQETFSHCPAELQVQLPDNEVFSQSVFSEETLTLTALSLVAPPSLFDHS